ncbi:MAG: formylglycine-generating enzyme family protein [Planctomycetota bacterium]
MSVAQASAAQAASSKPQAPKEDTVGEGLPTFLLPVPGGKVTMGLTIDQLVETACQTINPTRPELALKEEEKLVRNMSQCSSELGQEERTLPTFLLGKWPVTNKEYAVFVNRMKDLGTPVKAPFHWWRYGRKDSYDESLKDINTLFGDYGKMGPIMFWEQKGTELPFALVDDRGESIENYPVVYVSYRDALKFAGWLGMRLPTEEEWTRAARGDRQVIWPWGDREQVGDAYTGDQVLAELQLKNARDQRVKPVGSVKFGTGPFGHVDMTGQVWELTAERNFGPICGQKAFEQEWKRAQKHKVGEHLPAPTWRDAYVVVKGGSFLSWPDPIQLHIDARSAVQTDDVLEGLGFRLAKSLKPGYDMLISLVTSDYNMDLFATGREGDQEVDFAGQVGIERYVLDKDGFPEAYHAVSIAPINWLKTDRNYSVKKLEEDSRDRPILVGTLATTEQVQEPALKAGLYSVAWRAGGYTKELTDAIKAGYKEVQAELRRKERGIDAKPEEDQELKKADWRSVLARFGLEAKDLEPKGADKDLNIVRFGGLEVPADHNVFLFHDNKGSWVGWCKANDVLSCSLTPAEVVLGTGKAADKSDRAKVEFKVRLPLLKDQKKGVEYKLDLLLEQGPPAAGQNWRVPTGG